jgi:fructose-bisphosphate aldolase class II
MLMDRAHSASVPISVHLDHATDADQLELAVGLAEKGIAFDSIMVDASHADVSLPRVWQNPADV